MKTTLLTLAISLIIIIDCNSQPVIVWEKTLGGTNHEYSCNTIPTSDGGMAFVGFSESDDVDVSDNNGGVDLWVGKLDSDGVLTWSYLYGGSETDKGFDILQTDDGGYMVAGMTASFDGDVTGHQGSWNNDFWVLKLSPEGELTWAKCYGGPNDESGAAIAQTTEGDFYIAGTTYSDDGDITINLGENDFWVIKIDSDGTLLHQKSIGGSMVDEGISLCATADNGCIVCGRTFSSDNDAVGYHDGSDMLVAKLSTTLTVEWSACYGGSETEECNSIVQLDDESFAALGYTSTHNNGDVTGHHGSQGTDDFWLLKLSSTGDLTSAKCFGGSSDDQANGLIATSDGNFVLCGLTNSNDGDVSGFHTSMFEPDVWVAEVNSIGDLIWQRCCGGSAQDEGFNVFELSNNTFVVTAFTYSSNFDVTNNYGSADAWIFKITNLSEISNAIDDGMLTVYPNPANDYLNIEISDANNYCFVEISNIVGSVLKSSRLNNNQNIIDISDLSKGVYFVHVTIGESKITNKIIKQ